VGIAMTGIIMSAMNVEQNARKAQRNTEHLFIGICCKKTYQNKRRIFGMKLKTIKNFGDDLHENY